MSTPEDRAAYIADMRRLMDILEANPDLPLPGSGSGHPFILSMPFGAVPAHLAAWEAALGIPLTAHIRGGLGEPDSDDGTYYDLEGQVEGLKIVIRAWRDEAVERRVTGTRTVETVEWVRLPAEPEAADDDDSPEATS